MIKTIKFIHTVIWLIMVLAVFYVLYAGIFNIFNVWLLVSIVLVVIEGSMLVLNKFSCPITLIAKKYTKSRKDNFDIYLPVWLTKYNKIIFGTIFMVGLTLVVINFIQ